MGYPIIYKKVLAPSIKLIKILAPEVAGKAKPGNFVVVRVDEKGERIPLTIVDFNVEEGSITLVFLEVGVTTMKLGRLEVGDEVADFVGPLGNPTEIKHFGHVVCVGGGVGIAAIYPLVKAFKEAGNTVTSIIGARNAELLIFEDEIKSVSDKVYVTTDDGSKGRKGFVSDALKELIKEGVRIDRVYAVGPAIMMKVVSDVTKLHGIKTVVSLNSLMVDATGMCGVCRVEVGGKTLFTCIDGPEFDGHQVDFERLLSRLRIYSEEEAVALERLMGG
jgi:ferredoxin--NADP+ reductase